MFDIYICLVIIISCFLVTTFNLFFSVLSLAFVYFASIWVLFMLQAEFIGVSLFIIYLGAIVVLFLFVLMLVKFENINVKLKNINISFIFFNYLFLIFVLIFFIEPNFGMEVISGIKIQAIIIDDLLNQYTFVFCLNKLEFLINIEEIASILYSVFFIGFILISLLLCVSLLGAIAVVDNSNINI